MSESVTISPLVTIYRWFKTVIKQSPRIYGLREMSLLTYWNYSFCLCSVKEVCCLCSLAITKLEFYIWLYNCELIWAWSQAASLFLGSHNIGHFACAHLYLSSLSLKTFIQNTLLDMEHFNSFPTGGSVKHLLNIDSDIGIHFLYSTYESILSCVL